jgi:hypothetical protein
MPQNQNKVLSDEIGKSDENKPKLEVEDPSQISQHLNENKMNKMVELSLQNKAFRESYQNKKQDQQGISATFLKNKENKMGDKEIELLMEWLRNQR